MSRASIELRARLARAKKHFADLELAITSQAGGPGSIDTILVDHDLHRETYVVTVGNLTESPPDWPLLAGEVIHQLRSILDNIVCHMAIKNGQPASCCERTEFPIWADNTTEARKAFKKKVAQFVHPTALAEIERLQPYNGLKEHDPLWGISKLDIIDKHRTLVIVDKRVKVEAATLTNGVRTERKEFPDARWHRPVKGAKIAEVHAPGAGPEVQMHPEARRVIAFDQTGTDADNRPVLGMINKYIETVDGILTDFETKGLI